MKPKDKQPRYYLDAKSGEFVIDNYNFAKPFANFFPGIAGKYGIPMWAFYVNRGQGIASFGTKNKDHAILEFFAANKAWQLVSLQGFRTFIKVSDGKKSVFYEPFHNGFANLGFDLANRMRITSADLTLEEENYSLGLGVKVEYFTIPNDNYSALARILTVKNLGKKSKKIELIDGLPQVIPYGISNLFLKKLSRTIEAWMNIENLDKGVPFYKIDVDPTDRPQVIHVKEGNFYLGFYYDKGRPSMIKPMVDPQSIFGPVTDFSCPREFLRDGFRRPIDKLTRNKTPSAMLFKEFALKVGAEQTLYSLAGFMHSKDTLNASVPRIIKPGYLTQKKEENRKVIQELQEDIATSSSSTAFDLYSRQTYLDNIMRGGYPLVFNPSSSDSVFYLYARKHGDLERDYNKFQLQPTYFSQGNGNYRDINQNRRCDIWFHPDIKEENVVAFFNLIQTDGFNPLVVKGVSFTAADDIKKVLHRFIPVQDIPDFLSFLNKPFTPGDVILYLKENKIKLRGSCDEFLKELLSHSLKHQEAEHGEGFWTDHWTYNLDILENYLAVYPEKLREMVFHKRVFTFFDNSEIVKPRKEKYLVWLGKPRQLHSLTSCNAKRELIKKRTYAPHQTRTEYGVGKIYQSTLINKLLCLLGNKLASLDPFGCGIEMEADKPNWFDALNGLPALFGSSINETFELKRLVLFIKGALEKCGIERIATSDEIYDLVNSLGKLLEENTSHNDNTAEFKYWDENHRLKEDYREKTRLGLSGTEKEFSAQELTQILDAALKKLQQAINKAYDHKKNLYWGYFINEPVEYDTLKDGFIAPTKFIQKKLPLFLEAQVHALKFSKDSDAARKIYTATRSSGLYDKKLKMYKVTAPLSGQPEEIGRCCIFTPGWLENESIWLHMEYKYLLELLKSGLYEEFYRDFKQVLIPFQPPARYGRSILENSSFIVSSVFPDKTLHGNGFVARLSGSTAEFLEIWLLMNAGVKPFILDEKEKLRLQFKPILAGWLFRKGDKTYSFNFLGRTKVTYHNPRLKNTFGPEAVKPIKILFKDAHGKSIEINQDTIPYPYAEQVRSCQIKQIDIYLD